MYKNNNKGSILILSLWVLSFLSILAALVGTTIRGRVALISRIEDRSQLRFMLISGVRKAASVLRRDVQQNNAVYTPFGKTVRHNNSKDFKEILFPRGKSEVSYKYFDKDFNREITYYGVSDEEGRLNINTANRNELMRLINQAAMIDEQKSQEIADSIIDWREVGRSGPLSSGVTGDLGYETKNADFETIDELLLVAGMKLWIYEKIFPYVTVFGDGMININTAPREVLYALGLEGQTVDKILLVRRGSDGMEATSDDHIFTRTFDVASEVLSVAEMEIEEIKRIDWLNKSGRIKINSFNFRISTLARLDHRNISMTAMCIYNLPLQRIIYWREK